jgi:hypothetical protein
MCRREYAPHTHRGAPCRILDPLVHRKDRQTPRLPQSAVAEQDLEISEDSVRLDGRGENLIGEGRPIPQSD